MILAFFPCIRFEDRIILNFRGKSSAQQKWSDCQKLNYSMKLHDELNELYKLVSQLAYIALERGLRLIIENPCGGQHYLTRYWCLEPSLIDKDRRLDGDWFKKPTQYWFINCKPKHNLVFEPLEYVATKTIDNTRNTVERSLIHQQYADRFIRKYILDEIMENGIAT